MSSIRQHDEEKGAIPCNCVPKKTPPVLFKLNAANQKVADKEGYGNAKIKCCSFGSFCEPIAIGKQIITFVVEATKNALLKICEMIRRLSLLRFIRILATSTMHLYYSNATTM